MKKLLSFLIALAVILSLCLLGSAAAENARLGAEIGRNAHRCGDRSHCDPA